MGLFRTISCVNFTAADVFSSFVNHKASDKGPSVVLYAFCVHFFFDGVLGREGRGGGEVF